MSPIRLAIVGCGAVAEYVHLPVVLSSDQVLLTALVDSSLDRARTLADKWSVPNFTDDYRKVVGLVEAAIVAVPPHLHASISSHLLANGVHVLVEKPMALTVAEGNRMVSAAAGSGATLAVGLLRRLYPSSDYVRRLLDLDLLGRLVEFDFREGYVYAWQVASDSGFRKENGGGVLADLGSHVLDLLLFWLGDLDVTAYKDDAMGGVESDCIIRLLRADGVRGVVELSRTRRLPNVYTFRGERADLTITADAGSSSPEISLWLGSKRLSGVVESHHAEWLDTVRTQLRQFVEAISGGEPPAVSGREGLRVVELIESCRDVREPWTYPWLTPPVQSGSVIQ